MTQKKLACQETVELVTDYLETALLPEIKAQFEAHLAGCPSCTNYLDQMQQTLHLLRQLTDESAPPETRQQLLAKFQAWQRRSSDEKP
jgi:anti-sigma factor (TIGR02949 family)